MRKITIIGGGQSGLQLGLGLLKNGYSGPRRAEPDRRGDRHGQGAVQPVHVPQFGRRTSASSASISGRTPARRLKASSFPFRTPEGSGNKVIDWASRLDKPAYSPWTSGSRCRNGWTSSRSSAVQLVIAEAGIADLEALQPARTIWSWSPRARARSAGCSSAMRKNHPMTSRMRALALTYVTGMTPRPEHSAVCFNLIPGVGEYFVFPALTTSGPCEIMVFEGVPGGPMDCWADVKTPEAASGDLARRSSKPSCPGRPSALPRASN
jgi:hypothetical protein